MRGCGAAAEIETSRVLKHCSARLFPEAGLSLREKRASQNCAPTLVSSPCCLISHVTFQRWSVPVRAVSERGGEWGGSRLTFRTLLTAHSPPASGWYRSPDFYRFLGCFTFLLRVANSIFRREGRHPSRRKILFATRQDEPEPRYTKALYDHLIQGFRSVID